VVKAVVFDMDGVIFDSEKLFRKHWMITAKNHGIPEETMQTLCNLMAGATKEKNERLMKSRFGEDFDYMGFRGETMERLDQDILENGVELKPGVLELLEYLKEHGYKIGLATSTSRHRAQGNLENAGIIDVFDEIIYGDMIKKGKPSPDIYLKACEALHILPGEAMGIEDSLNGVKASSKAGLYTVMVIDLVEPTQEIRGMADQIYESLYDVVALLEKEV